MNQKFICVEDNWTLSGIGQHSYLVKTGTVLENMVVYNKYNEVVSVPPQGYFWSKIPESPLWTLHFLAYYKTVEQFREDRIDKVLC